MAKKPKGKKTQVDLTQVEDAVVAELSTLDAWLALSAAHL